MAEIKVGDVVEIKSGGPQMTVVDIYTGTAKCIWYEGKQFNEREFPILALDANVSNESGYNMLDQM